MTTRNKKARGPSKRARQNEECNNEDEEEPVTELARERNNERNTNNTPAVGIQCSTITTHIVNPPSNQPPTAAPAAAPANAELQATVTLANIENHSVIGAVSSFVSVGD